VVSSLSDLLGESFSPHSGGCRSENQSIERVQIRVSKSSAFASSKGSAQTDRDDGPKSCRSSPSRTGFARQAPSQSPRRLKLEVADIFRCYGEAYRQQHEGSLSTAERRVMTAIEGRTERCDRCHHERPCYDSCRDRHSLSRAEWVEKRTVEVPQTHYFMSSSRSPNRSLPSHTKTKISFTAFCFAPRPRPYPRSLPIPNIWELRSAFSPYSTAGDRT
jgi:hypothetical protein